MHATPSSCQWNKTAWPTVQLGELQANAAKAVNLGLTAGKCGDSVSTIRHSRGIRNEVTNPTNGPADPPFRVGRFLHFWEDYFELSPQPLGQETVMHACFQAFDGVVSSNVGRHQSYCQPPPDFGLITATYPPRFWVLLHDNNHAHQGGCFVFGGQDGN